MKSSGVGTVLLSWALLVPGCGTVGVGGLSDVPAFVPSAWPVVDFGELLLRDPGDGSDDLLLRYDEIVRWSDPGPGPVYRYIHSEQRLELVPDEVWEEAGTPLERQPGAYDWIGEIFDIQPSHHPHPQLYLRGERIPVAGGTVMSCGVLVNHDLAVVRSTAGGLSVTSLLMLLGPNAPERPSQNYHQLISTVDGSRVGEALRIPILREEDRMVLSPNEDYVVYYSEEQVGDFERRVGRVAVVRIADMITASLPPDIGDVHGLDPDTWGGETKGLLVRASGEEGDVLLVAELLSPSSTKPCEGREETCQYAHGPVYRYDPSTGSLAVVDDTYWDGSFEPIAPCEANGFSGADDSETRPAALAITDEEPPRLLLNDMEIAVAGGNPVAVIPAPESSVSAVLSAEGVLSPRGGFTRQYYHQLFSEDDGTPLGEATRLPRNAQNLPPNDACWSPDERYVVYSHEYRNVYDWLIVAPGYAPFAGDCDRDGIDDESAIAAGSPDCNSNGIPDECESSYVWFAHDFETDMGWAVGAAEDDARTGIWTRGDPEQDRTATGFQVPVFDHTPGAGVSCYVTAIWPLCDDPDNCDVDEGRTTLFSPVFDLTVMEEPSISYWRWFTNARGITRFDDPFVVDISPDNGSTWTNVETLGPEGEYGSELDGGWFLHSFVVSQLIEPTSQVRLRFIAADEGEGSFIEAAVDDFMITSPACPP